MPHRWKLPSRSVLGRHAIALLMILSLKVVLQGSDCDSYDYRASPQASVYVWAKDESGNPVSGLSISISSVRREQTHNVSKASISNDDKAYTSVAETGDNGGVLLPIDAVVVTSDQRPVEAACLLTQSTDKSGTAPDPFYDEDAGNHLQDGMKPTYTNVTVNGSTASALLTCPSGAPGAPWATYTLVPNAVTLNSTDYEIVSQTTTPSVSTAPFLSTTPRTYLRYDVNLVVRHKQPAPSASPKVTIPLAFTLKANRILSLTEQRIAFDLTTPDNGTKAMLEAIQSQMKDFASTATTINGLLADWRKQGGGVSYHTLAANGTAVPTSVNEAANAVTLVYQPYPEPGDNAVRGICEITLSLPGKPDIVMGSTELELWPAKATVQQAAGGGGGGGPNPAPTPPGAPPPPGGQPNTTIGITRGSNPMPGSLM